MPLWAEKLVPLVHEQRALLQSMKKDKESLHKISNKAA